MGGLLAVRSKLGTDKLADDVENRLSVRFVEAIECSSGLLQFIDKQSK